MHEGSCRDLKALIKLLTLLTQRDILDFGGSDSAANPDVAQVTLFAISVMAPSVHGQVTMSTTAPPSLRRRSHCGASCGMLLVMPTSCTCQLHLSLIEWQLSPCVCRWCS